jgi:L-ascorbate metabolism protein UlaG (beta-lactamase superfamily)
MSARIIRYIVANHGHYDELSAANIFKPSREQPCIRLPWISANLVWIGDGLNKTVSMIRQ